MLTGYPKNYVRKTASLVCLLALVVVIPGFLSARAGTQQPPTPDFMAAALRSQDTGTLDVSYTQFDASGTKPFRKFHYIRTPEAIYLQMEKGFPPKHRDVERFSYDRSTSEVKGLDTCEERGTTRGRIIDHLAFTPLAEQDIIETARYPVFLAVPGRLESFLLHEGVQHGTVSPEQEEIDGRPCWRVDLDKPGSSDLRTFWLDQSIGFCPRRVRFDQGGGHISTFRFQDYKEVAQGIWFPMKMVTTAGDSPATVRAITKVTEIHTDRTYSKDEVLIKFPSGTQVFIGHDSVIAP